MEYAVSTRCLTKKFRNHTAVNGINLHVKKGEIYGFIGRNGAGKTTCMKMISGLSTPTSGEISLFGKQDSEAGEMRGRIGILIENPGLYPNMNAYENLKCKCLALGIHKKGLIADILEQVGLQDTGNKKVRNFSLGMKQRLGIGMALLGEPDLLILDEPINGLDPQGIAEVRETLKNLNRKKGMTIMISSHILEELHKVADTFGIIHNGELVQELSKEQLEEKCSDYIEIIVQNAEHVCTILENMGIRNYRVIDSGMIQIYERLDESGLINAELAKRNCMINSIRVTHEKLENYFLELTK